VVTMERTIKGRASQYQKGNLSQVIFFAEILGGSRNIQYYQADFEHHFAQVDNPAGFRTGALHP